jgi:hypothetical protein
MNKKSFSRIIRLVGFLTVAPCFAWAPKQAPLMTEWASQVDPKSPLPEYPRPQMARAEWLNLNGVWEFQPGTESDLAPTGKKLASEILVPFPVESALSGVMQHYDRLWYRRSFEVPPKWDGKRILLHFGAVDYESEVFINGKSLGIHKGGYDPFTWDITSNLSGKGGQELLVRVFDPTEAGGQPRGKQTTAPGGIMYTPTTGIWQTVWLEPVPSAASIKSLAIVPDVDAGRLKLTVHTSGDVAKISVKVKDSGAVIQSAEGAPETELSIPIPNAKLWSPDNPFLYDLEVSLTKDDGVVDKVASYFGMRKISLGDVGGIKKMFLNNKFVFEIGPLDQGFWPDGIYTAPTEAALKSDIEQTKAFGFNMIRKHIKVEPARWYYWTDKLGVLVWQDMPSADSYLPRTFVRPPVDTAEFETELRAMVENLRNVPSIIMWDIFNEGQGQHDTEQLVAMVKKLDPSRLVNQASGGNRVGVGDVFDIHHYPPPECPAPFPGQASVCGEYGGIGYLVKGHSWREKGGGYTNVSNPEDLVFLYAEFSNRLKTFRDEKGLSAAVYTQTTDVETELNGLLTYDRVPKAKAAEIAKANHLEFPPPTYTALMPTSEKEVQAWRYTTTAPAGDNWLRKDFDDSAWTEGNAGFGKYGALGNTPWDTPEIWLRKSFNPGELTPDQIRNLVFEDQYRAVVRIFINGVNALSAGGDTGYYEHRNLSDAARSAILPNATNVIAVHCVQRKGAVPYFDAGLYLRVPAE